jgi:methylglyoxal synthase
MEYRQLTIEHKKRIALVAHDNKKGELLEWAKNNKALLRIAVVWNIPIACNRASADFMISSPLMSGAYQRLVPDYTHYRSQVRGDRPVD